MHVIIKSVECWIQKRFIMWLRFILFVCATLAMIHAAPNGGGGPISELNVDDPEEIEQNYLFSEETRVVHVPLEEEASMMSDTEIRHNAKELFLEEEEIRSEIAAGSGGPQSGVSVSTKGNHEEAAPSDLTTSIVKKDEEGRQAEDTTTETSASSDASSASTDSKEDSDEEGVNNNPPTESTDALLEKSISELSSDTSQTDQNGSSTSNPDDEDPESADALSSFDPDEDDDDEIAPEDVGGSGGQKGSSCTGRNDCVFLIQDNQLFGPYFIPDLVEKMGHTEKDVILTVNNRKIPGRMFGPLKARPRHRTGTADTTIASDEGPLNSPLALIYCSLTQKC